MLEYAGLPFLYTLKKLHILSFFLILELIVMYELFHLLESLCVLQNQLETAAPHELKNTFQLLHEILASEDNLRLSHFKCQLLAYGSVEA